MDKNDLIERINNLLYVPDIILSPRTKDSIAFEKKLNNLKDLAMSYALEPFLCDLIFKEIQDDYNRLVERRETENDKK